MKVTKTGAAKGPDAARKARKSGNDGAFADALRGASEAGQVDRAQSTGGVNAVGAILAVQQTADATDHRSRGLMMAHGEQLLEHLDDLRISILNGSVSKDRLQDMARRLRERKTGSDDQKLNDLVDEIEMRVEIEIAKLTR